MRLTCPHCGERDLREFTYKGDALALMRPSEDADPQKWNDYLHNRDNPAGVTLELWYHGPCGTWCVVERDTVTHITKRTLTLEEARS
ncbi:MAG: sarcosine oxidase subunit delta [Pseudomonadota bacterium]